MTLRSCACGCGAPFVAKHPAHLYAHPTHRPPRPQHPGRGTAYKQARARLFATPPGGAPCPRCGQAMTNEQWARKQLDAGHVYDLVLHPNAPILLRYEHSSCGRSAGASLGNRLRVGGRDVRRSRAW